MPWRWPTGHQPSHSPRAATSKCPLHLRQLLQGSKFSNDSCIVPLYRRYPRTLTLENCCHLRQRLLLLLLLLLNCFTRRLRCRSKALSEITDFGELLPSTTKKSPLTLTTSDGGGGMKGKRADGAAVGRGFAQGMAEIILDIGAETEDEWTNALFAGQILKSQLHSAAM